MHRARYLFTICGDFSHLTSHFTWAQLCHNSQFCNTKHIHFVIHHKNEVITFLPALAHSFGNSHENEYCCYYSFFFWRRNSFPWMGISEFSFETSLRPPLSCPSLISIGILRPIPVASTLNTLCLFKYMMFYRTRPVASIARLTVPMFSPFVMRLRPPRA